MLLPARTAQYIEALNREGDCFDYRKWLQRRREQEGTPAEHVPAHPQSDKAVVSGVIEPINMLGNEVAEISLTPPPIAKVVSFPRPLSRNNHQAIADTPNARLRRRLEKVCDAWHEFQSNRARDGVYRYLEAVFAIVVHHKVRRRTKRLLRRAFDFADLPFNKMADPFAAVIRCTCDRSVDNKTISKWARALRYVAYCKVPQARLKAFMKEAGGVNACAARYARYYGRGGR
jgi:hypothetical protein